MPPLEASDGTIYLAESGWVGCPHCGGPVDVRAHVDRGAREVAERVFDLLYAGTSPLEVLHPLELLISDCERTERAARDRALPLKRLALDAQPTVPR